MAIPSGTGTEVLGRGTVHALSNSATALKFDGTDNSSVGTNTVTVPSNHIITLFNMTFAEAGGNAETINLIINDGNSDIYLFRAQPLPASSTFSFNEKVVIIGGAKVTVFCDSAANVDVYYSYIDQDFT